MGTNSKIEWTDATWNPATGCTPVSPGCRHCYAKSLSKRFPQIHGGGGQIFEKIVLHPERLEQPRTWKKPRRIFVCSMGDLFHADVPFEFIHDVFDITQKAYWHEYLFLTKRPENMLNFIKTCCIHQGGETVQDGRCHHWMRWPLPNVWIGVTAESQQQADERIQVLLEIPAAVRFVSVEPMIGPVDLSGYFGTAINGGAEVAHEYTYNAGIKWVICGGENGPGARPMHPDWAYVLRDQCQGARVPFFFKGFGAWTPISTDRYEADGHLRFRGKKYPIRRIDSEGRDITNLDGLHNNETDSLVINVGKKQAGRMLDGTEFNQFPKQKETK